MTVPERLILVGGGGHCKSCIEVVESTGGYEVYGILDVTDRIGDRVLGYPIIGSDRMIPELVSQGFCFLVSLGQIKSSKPRRDLFGRLKREGAHMATVIAASARVSKHARISPGTIVHHGCHVNAGAEVGENCIINTGSNLEHDVIVMDHTHISTGCMLNGNASVGRDCFLGSGTIISNGVSIGDEVVVGAGSLILRSIREKGTYVGLYNKK
jgi:sugar O-acyltransferase (sialic acid O-acetyltransferase NeuD family)